MEELPAALLGHTRADAAAAGGSGSEEEEAQGGRSGARQGPCLLRLLAHGNQLEAAAEQHEPLALPWQVWRARRLDCCAAAGGGCLLGCALPPTSRCLYLID